MQNIKRSGDNVLSDAALSPACEPLAIKPVILPFHQTLLTRIESHRTDTNYHGEYSRNFQPGYTKLSSCAVWRPGEVNNLGILGNTSHERCTIACQPIMTNQDGGGAGF